MIQNDLQQILSIIFEPTILPDELPSNVNFQPPSFEEVLKISQLILEDKPEESFQKFFAENPHFLFRSSPSSGDPILGLLAKPPISNFYNADFAILTAGQGGCGITLIELEKPSDALFTKKLTPNKKFQAALGQVIDWNEWLRVNKQTFVNTIMELLKKAPMFPEKTGTGSFKCKTNAQLEKTWRAFGGYEDCNFGNLIVIGRWSKLNEKERKRLLFLNNLNKSLFFQIRTYEQLIRKAYDGPSIFW